MMMTSRVRVLAAAVALAALFAVGCSPVASRCQDGTLLVAVTLDATSDPADQLSITVSVDGVAAPPSLVPRNGTADAGNVVVQFPHGYPRGHVIGVAVEALIAGVVVGSGSASQPLDAACEVLPLAVTGTSPSSDLGGSDLADAGAPPADLLVPPDLTCIPTAESGDSCFDGVDNDCDGLVDCADPDCTAGAQCVPTVSAAFTLGITVAQASFCPAMYSSRAVINSGLATTGGTDCPAGSCTCSGSMNCTSGITSFQALTCGGESDDNSVGNSCRNFDVTGPGKSLTSDAIINGGGLCNSGGSSTRNPSAWASSQRFCQTSALGGGCAPGNVCVPKLAVPTCAVADGVVACDAGYTASGGPWYTTFTDGRSCGCHCGAASGGSCGTTLGLYTNTTCAGSPTTTMTASQACTNNATVFRTTMIQGGTLPTCGGASATVSGSLMPMGQQTLCCRP